jgi:hypothetical protein
MGEILRRGSVYPQTARPLVGGTPTGAPPADPTAYPGMAQGAHGGAQGGIGSIIGQLFGPADGMLRARTGGMEPSPLSALIARLFAGNAERTTGAGGGIPDPSAPRPGGNVGKSKGFPGKPAGQAGGPTSYGGGFRGGNAR